MDPQICTIGAGEGLRAVTFERVKEDIDKDEEMLELRDVITNGEDVNTERLKPYK